MYFVAVFSPVYKWDKFMVIAAISRLQKSCNPETLLRGEIKMLIK
jgi:hypothetical protein